MLDHNVKIDKYETHKCSLKGICYTVSTLQSLKFPLVFAKCLTREFCRSQHIYLGNYLFKVQRIFALWSTNSFATGWTSVKLPCFLLIYIVKKNKLRRWLKNVVGGPEWLGHNLCHRALFVKRNFVIFKHTVVLAVSSLKIQFIARCPETYLINTSASETNCKC